MTKSEAVAIANEHAGSLQIRNQTVRDAVFVPIGHPFHLSWEPNDIWLIYFQVERPSGIQLEPEDGITITVDNFTKSATLFRAL